MTTKRKKLPPYDWRRVEAALRAAPGVWHDLPIDLPLLNPSRVHDGQYRGAFAHPFAFEVEGWERGLQRARYVGEADPMPFYMRLVPSPAHLAKRVKVDAWLEHREWSDAGPGFTTLPLDDGEATPAPLILAESTRDGAARPSAAHVIEEGGRGQWAAIAEAARERPGEWHRILGRWGAYSTPIRRGVLAAFRPVGAWDARMRDYELEVRYVGEVER